MSDAPAGSAIHVVLTFDDNFWAPAFAVARSVCLTTTRKRDLVFHFIHDGLRPEHRSDFATLADEFGCRIVHHELAEHVEFNALCRSLPVDSRLHVVMYARLLVDRFLPPGTERVVYLDCDTLVLAPIERLYEIEMAGLPIAAVSDPRRLMNMLGRDMREKRGLFEGTEAYFNSGVLLIDVARFAAADIPARIAEFRARGVLDKLYFDQDMLNLIFSGQWTVLPWRFNVTEPRLAHETMDPWILHYTGHERPWNLVSRAAHRRTYRRVMTNELFYRYLRHRWGRWWKKRLGLR